MKGEAMGNSFCIYCYKNAHARGCPLFIEGDAVNAKHEHEMGTDSAAVAANMRKFSSCEVKEDEMNDLPKFKGNYLQGYNDGFENRGYRFPTPTYSTSPEWKHPYWRGYSDGTVQRHSNSLDSRAPAMGVTEKIIRDGIRDEMRCTTCSDSWGTCGCPNHSGAIAPGISSGNTRTFETGATRDTDEGKYDYEAFLSPLVIERYGKYMHKCRTQSDGTLRAGDNWQLGMPFTAFIKSGFRHFIDWWLWHRSKPEHQIETFDKLEDTLCALLFNVSGYLHERLKARRKRSA